MISHKTLLVFLTFTLNTVILFSQNFSIPFSPYKGDVKKVYAVEQSGEERTGDFSFKSMTMRTSIIESLDEKNRLQSSVFYYEGQTILFETVFLPDSSGKLIKAERYNNKGVKNLLCQYNYNSDGTVKSIEAKKLEGEIITRYDYAYTNGKLSKTIQQNLTDDKKSVEYFFDNEYLSEIKIFDENKDLISHKTYSLNEHGDPIKSETRNATGELLKKSTFLYEYDASGNFTKRLEFKREDDSALVTNRTIVYRKDYQTNFKEEDLSGGVWLNWDGQTLFNFEANGKYSMKSKVIKRDGKGTFQYSPTGKTLTVGDKYNREKYRVEFDGKILSLYSEDSYKRHFHIIKTPYPIGSYQQAAQQNKVQFTGKYNSSGQGLLNLNGNFIYSEEYFISYLNDKRVKVTKDNLYALGDYKGKILTDFKYKELRRLDRENTRFKLPGDAFKWKYGVINSDGKVIVEPIYATLKSCGEGCFIAQILNSTRDFTVIKTDGSAPTEYIYLKYQDLNRILATVEKRDSENKASAKQMWLDGNFEPINLPDNIRVPQQKLGYNLYVSAKDKMAILLDSSAIDVRVYDDERLKILKKIELLHHHLLVMEKGEKYALSNVEGDLLTDFDYDRIITAQSSSKTDRPSTEFSTATAAYYQKGNEFGGLNGFGEETEFTLPNLLSSDRFYPILETPNLAKFKYSFYWKPGSNGNLIYKGKRNKANVKLDLLYVGEENTKDFVKKYLIGNGLSTELQEGTTDGKKSYTSITNSERISSNQPFRKDLFIVKEDKNLVHLTFSCDSYMSIFLASEFFIMEQTLEILK